MGKQRGTFPPHYHAINYNYGELIYWTSVIAVKICKYLHVRETRVTEKDTKDWLSYTVLLFDTGVPLSSFFWQVAGLNCWLLIDRNYLKYYEIISVILATKTTKLKQLSAPVLAIRHGFIGLKWWPKLPYTKRSADNRYLKHSITHASTHTHWYTNTPGAIYLIRYRQTFN